MSTALLNRYFREYYDQHGQGGTHTQQRNIIQLFNFLEREYGQPLKSARATWEGRAAGSAKRTTSTTPAVTRGRDSCGTGRAAV